MNETILPLVTFAVVTTGTPGGATALATASGVRFGFRRSVPLIVGIAGGLAALAAAASVGLASLVMAVPGLSFAMKLAGTAYLLWLAWKIGKAGSPRVVDGPGTPTGILGGAFLLLLNPKGWAMALGAAASFTAAANGPLQLAALLAIILGTASALSLSFWCMGGQMLAKMLRTDRQWHVVNAVLGVLLATSVLPIWIY
jgi:threonine/homoserine/homoserine lactone efflux protein